MHDAAYLIKGGHPQEAYDMLRLDDLVQSEDVNALVGAAAYFLNSRDYQMIQVPVQRAHALAPDNPSVLGFVGKYHILAGEYEEAEDVIDTALEMDPLDITAMHAQGILETARGHYQAAVNTLTEAILHNGTIPTLYVDRGYARFNADDVHGAIADYTRAIKIFPFHERALLHRAEAYRHLAEKDERMLHGLQDMERVHDMMQRFDDVY